MINESSNGSITILLAPLSPHPPLPKRVRPRKSQCRPPGSFCHSHSYHRTHSRACRYDYPHPETSTHPRPDANRYSHPGASHSHAGSSDAYPRTFHTDAGASDAHPRASHTYAGTSDAYTCTFHTYAGAAFSWTAELVARQRKRQ